MSSTLILAIVDNEEQMWELYDGAWNCVRGMSANGYWRDASEPIASDELVEKTATIKAVGSLSGVFYFEDRDAFDRFIIYYLRGSIVEEVVS